jgi:hypothetical protein
MVEQIDELLPKGMGQNTANGPQHAVLHKLDKTAAD